MSHHLHVILLMAEIRRSPVEVGSLSHYLWGFSTIPGGCLGFQPSTSINSISCQKPREISKWHPPKQSRCCPLSHSDGENLGVFFSRCGRWPVGFHSSIGFLLFLESGEEKRHVVTCLFKMVGPKDLWTLKTGYFEDLTPAIQVQTLPSKGPRSLGGGDCFY